MAKVITTPKIAVDKAGGDQPAYQGVFLAHIDGSQNPDHSHTIAKDGTFSCDECGQLILDAQKANENNYKGYEVK